MEDRKTSTRKPPAVPGAGATTLGLELAVRRCADRDLVEVHGELDVATAPALGQCLARLTAKVVELDLRQLTFVDCAGVAVLLVAARDLGDGRQLVLRSPARAADRVLALLQVGDQICIERRAVRCGTGRGRRG